MRRSKALRDFFMPGALAASGPAAQKASSWEGRRRAPTRAMRGQRPHFCYSIGVDSRLAGSRRATSASSAASPASSTALSLFCTPLGPHALRRGGVRSLRSAAADLASGRHRDLTLPPSAAQHPVVWPLDPVHRGCPTRRDSRAAVDEGAGAPRAAMLVALRCACSSASPASAKASTRCWRAYSPPCASPGACAARSRLRRFAGRPKESTGLSAQLLRDCSMSRGRAVRRCAGPCPPHSNAAAGRHRRPPGNACTNVDGELVDDQGRRWTPVFVLHRFESRSSAPAAGRATPAPDLPGASATCSRIECRPPLPRGSMPRKLFLDRIDVDGPAVPLFSCVAREASRPSSECRVEPHPDLGRDQANRHAADGAESRAAQSVLSTGGALVGRRQTHAAADRGSPSRVQPRPRSRDGEERRIEPALLTPVCASPNARSAGPCVDTTGARLDVTTSWKLRGATRSLDRFYDEAFIGAGGARTVRAAARIRSGEP